MSGSETRVSRMPEIENIALREALKDFGFEAVEAGDDIVLHLGSGPEGLFVSKAEKVVPGGIGTWHKKGLDGKARRDARAREYDSPQSWSPAREPRGSSARDTYDSAYKYSRKSFEECKEILRREQEKAVTSEPPKDVGSTETWLDEAIDALCQENLGKAFELASASLARSAQMMAEIVEDTRRDLIDIAVRRERIDRTQAEIREILAGLIEDAPQ